MTDTRKMDALAFLHNGIDLIFRTIKCDPKAKVQNLKLAIEEVRSGLAVMEYELAEAERQVRRDENDERSENQ